MFQDFLLSAADKDFFLFHMDCMEFYYYFSLLGKLAQLYNRSNFITSMTTADTLIAIQEECEFVESFDSSKNSSREDSREIVVYALSLKISNFYFTLMSPIVRSSRISLIRKDSLITVVTEAFKSLLQNS